MSRSISQENHETDRSFQGRLDGLAYESRMFQGGGLQKVEFYFVSTVFLVLSIVLGLVRIFLGPNRSDRMLVVQLFGTTGIAVLLLMARTLSMPELENIALVLALLAVMLAVTYNRRVSAGAEGAS